MNGEHPYVPLPDGRRIPIELGEHLGVRTNLTFGPGTLIFAYNALDRYIAEVRGYAHVHRALLKMLIRARWDVERCSALAHCALFFGPGETESDRILRQSEQAATDPTIEAIDHEFALPSLLVTLHAINWWLQDPIVREIRPYLERARVDIEHLIAEVQPRVEAALRHVDAEVAQALAE